MVDYFTRKQIVILMNIFRHFNEVEYVRNQEQWN